MPQDWADSAELLLCGRCALAIEVVKLIQKSVWRSSLRQPIVDELAGAFLDLHETQVSRAEIGAVEGGEGVSEEVRGGGVDRLVLPRGAVPRLSTGGEVDPSLHVGAGHIRGIGRRGRRMLCPGGDGHTGAAQDAPPRRSTIQGRHAGETDQRWPESGSGVVGI